jgi:hypothetical protein
MNIKIKKFGGSLQIINQTTGKIVLSQPSTDVWYSEISLKRGVIQFYDANTSRTNVGNYESYFLTDAVDSNGVSFTKESFREFIYNNLGFTPIFTLNTFATRVMTLSGGFLVENVCYGS